MAQERRAPLDSTELTREEKEATLRALGYYQIHLFDEISRGSDNAPDHRLESKLISNSIKKIHKSIE